MRNSCFGGCAAPLQMCVQLLTAVSQEKGRKEPACAFGRRELRAVTDLRSPATRLG